MTPEEKQQNEKQILQANLFEFGKMVEDDKAYEASRQIEIINVCMKYWIQSMK